MSLVSLFCKVDDFCLSFEPAWEAMLIEEEGHSRGYRRLSLIEVMTITIFFHQRHYRNFKHFYCDYLSRYHHQDFPGLVSYTRFLELMTESLIPLTVYLKCCCLGRCDGLSFIDSSALAVCDNHRIHSHRVFKGLAARGKTSTGWFYGFKLHLVVSHKGELLSVCLTAGNTDDRKPVLKLLNHITGMVYADKGYIAKWLKEILEDDGIRFVAKPKKNMKKVELSNFDRVALRHRAVIETIYDQLKNISQIEHTRHRSICNFAVNVIAGLAAYSEQEKKPSFDLETLSHMPLAA